MSNGNLYQQLPGNPFLRKALDLSNLPAARQVFATLAVAYETRTQTMQLAEDSLTKRMHHNNFSTPANLSLRELREQLQIRTTIQDNDND